MSDASKTRSVIVEREISFPPEKIWRALTQPHLIEEWLMKNDFKPAVDHSFRLSGDWGGVDCRVLTVEPNKTLSYTWGGVESVVTWTLTPTSTGTHLRMEHAGLRARPAAGLHGRQTWLAAVLCQAGSGRGERAMKKSAPPKTKSPSQLIDARIKELGDWRGEMLGRVRALIKDADPEVVEEWKWRGVPTWYHDGTHLHG